MPIADHQYLLEISGKALSKTQGDDENWYRPSFTQKEHHFTFQNAFDALIREPAGLFEKNSEEAFDAKLFFETASIKHILSDECLCRIVIMSIEDSADGMPTAGIYISSEDREIHELEKMTGYDFSRFKEYDRGFPFVLLVRFAYDRGLEMIYDPEYLQLQDAIKQKELGKTLDENDWKYCVYDILETKTHPQHAEKEVFTFHEGKTSFQSFVKSTIHKLEEKQAADEQQSFSSGFYKRNGDPVAEIFRVSVADDQDRVKGIYMQIHTSPEEFRQITGMDISSLHTEIPGSYLLFNTEDKSEKPKPTIAWTFFSKEPTADQQITRKYSSFERRQLPPSPGGMKI